MIAELFQRGHLRADRTSSEKMRTDLAPLLMVSPRVPAPEFR